MGSFRPGKVISAGVLNRVEDLAERAGRPVVGPPLEVVRSPAGNLSRLTTAPAPLLVRITGKVKENYFTTPPDDHYSGYPQLSVRDDAGSVDLLSGITFFADSLPLKSVDGDTGIATGTLVYAFPAPSGDHYLFLKTGGSSTVGVRTLAGVQEPGTGNLYVTDPDTGIYYYLGDIQGNPPPTPPDTGQLVWEQVYYQENVFGSLPNIALNVGLAYTSVPMGVSVTETIDLRDAPPHSLLDEYGNPVRDQDGNIIIISDPTHIVSLTLPVYRTYWSPGSIVCDGVHPVLIVRTS